jgi:hypothetical protein
MADLLPVTLDEMIAEMEREIAMRRTVYPRLRSLRPDRAERQIDIALAILAKLVAERETTATTCQTP